MGLFGTSKTGEPTLEELYTLAGLGDTAQRYAAAHPKSPEALLEKLSFESALVCKAVAENPNTPVETLIRLAENRSDVSVEVSQHPRLPGAQLAQLALSHNNPTKEQVAKHPNTPPEALTELTFDFYVFIRSAALKNPNTPKEQVELITQLTTPGALPVEKIEALSQHKYHWIRAMVASHPNLPKPVIERLSKDINIETKFELLKNTTLTAQVDQLLLENVTFANLAASSRSHPPNRMVLARHPDLAVRLALAKNPRINAELLAELLNDKEKSVREAAEQNDQSRDIKLLLSHKT